MFRNKGLTDLDDRFAQLGRKYGIREDFDPSLEELEDEEFVDSDGDEAGEPVTRWLLLFTAFTSLLGLPLITPVAGPMLNPGGSPAAL